MLELHHPGRKALTCYLRHELAHFMMSVVVKAPVELEKSNP